MAGLATLCTNALPIIAGIVLLGEPLPAGLFGVLRVVAFCAVVGGAILLATPEHATAATPRAAGPPAAARAAGGREGGRTALMTQRF